MKTRTRFFFQKISWRDCYDVWIQRTDFLEGRPIVAFATNVELRTRPPEEEGMEVAPVMSISQADAQEIMDGLYACGLRPSQTPNTTSVVPALERHLADMRAIASRFMQVELP